MLTRKHTFSSTMCLAVAAVALWLPGGMARAESPYDLAWTRQLGTASLDESRGVSADRLGNVYISGYTSGSLGGPNSGSDDAFLAKFSSQPRTYGVFIGSNDYNLLTGEVKVNGVDDAINVMLKFNFLKGFADARMLTYQALDVFSNPWGDISSVLDEFTNVIKPGDNLIFFYSGHGGGSQSDPGVDESLAVAWFRNIVDDDLAGWFLDDSRRDTWAGVNKLFILDSCFTGGFWNGEDADLSGLERVALLAAAPEMDWALSNPDAEGQGYFSLALAEGLTKVDGWALADTDKDGLTVQDLMVWLKDYYVYQQGITGYLRDGWSDELFTGQ